MFSGRSSAFATLIQAGAVTALNKLLSPLFPTVVVINAANAVGNMSEDLNFRLSFRANGGVGALVRLLRDDVDAAVQVRGNDIIGIMYVNIFLVKHGNA